ncbi:cupin domain-containing protein [Nocardia inohanensis]|uniref:cupin domain-containing protein n=1 Tax=Nocardia inohanensis TaxID=209246 RepID=UPI0008366285|nr:cupin domain-containing protein [Nocardia inohanensis]
MPSHSELRRDLPMFEIYSGANGARVELHPWFFVAGKQYLGLTRVLPPGTGRGPAHVHTGTVQHSFLLAGESARYRCGRRTGRLKVGEPLIIPSGTPHVDPYNDTGQPIVVRTLYSPGPVWLLSFGKTLGQSIRDGKVNSQQELHFLHLLMMLGTPGSVTFAATIPVAFQQRVLLPLAGRIARRRGYGQAAGLRAHIFR